MFHSDMENFSMWTSWEKIIVTISIICITPCTLVLIGAFLHYIGVF